MHKNIVQNGNNKQYQKAEHRKYQTEGLVLMDFLKIISSPVLFNISINGTRKKIGSISMNFIYDTKSED